MTVAEYQGFNLSRECFVVTKLSLCLFSLLFVQAQDSGTLEAVTNRGELRCGVSGLPPGELVEAEDGGLVGFYTEFCRAVAAAVLGDQEAVAYLPLSMAESFSALRRGDVDLLVGSVAQTVSRDAEVDFAPVVFHSASQHYAPALRQGDSFWRDTVSWTIYTLIQAEEWGIDSANVGSLADATQSAAMLARFLELEEALVAQLGLEPDALRRMIAQVGNYGEVYDRHLGPDATLSLPRGPNRLWNEGGLLYAPPFSAR
ncbi:MAG TPA: transporter substrate-binding domain-containing protein [Chloroflexota bacterium]|nr:transporter substrate-binding domain-containing protein [Chloroflexota bacterium]